MSLSPRFALVLDQLQTFFQQNSISAYMVGGCVRDLLLRRTVHDLDLVVDGDAVAIARQVARLFQAAFVLLDRENAVARVVQRKPDGGPGDTLDFTRMRGGELVFDLAKRDFTINAMATTPESFGQALQGQAEPEVIDPYCGRADLEAHCLRAVSDRSFLDDPLRTMRVVRFAGELRFSVDTRTVQWAREAAQLLPNVSWERIRDELTRLLACAHAAPYLPLLQELQLLDRVLPEVGVGTCSPAHAWETVCCLEWIVARLERNKESKQGPLWQPAALETHPKLTLKLPYGPQLQRYLHEQLSDERTRLVQLKLAALLHHLQGEKDGAAAARQVGRRLRLSNREAVDLGAAADALSNPVVSGTGEGSRRLAYRFYRDVGEVATGVLLLSLADDLATAGRELDLEWWSYRVSRVSWILTLRFERYNQVIDPPRLLDGGDLMTMLDLPPGPTVGRLLEEMREAQAAGEIHSREEALEWGRQWILQNRDRSEPRPF